MKREVLTLRLSMLTLWALLWQLCPCHVALSGLFPFAIQEGSPSRSLNGPAIMIVHKGFPGDISDSLAVRVQGICKAYRRGTSATPVLDGIDLTVARGECVFLAGPSGSGKTTLLSILGCILSADCGRVCVLDHDVLAMDQGQRASFRLSRIGFVFQRFHLIRGLTVLENVCVPLALAGTTSKAARQQGMVHLEAVGLADKINAHPNNLSTGQCQRVALARALACAPELILADEPTASLDAENGREVMKLLPRLATEDGRTAVVVTHDPRIFEYADRVHHLENGRIARTEQPAAVVPY